MRRPLNVLAPAKLNLFLHVGEKRLDGFHDLESLVAFVACGDKLEFEPYNELSLSVQGPNGTELSTGEENLALRAARLLAEETGCTRGARIVLQKNLPVASGLGGGSADAAAVLRGLNQLWQCRLGESELRRIAALLGADVPVCVGSATAWMEGMGERLRVVRPLPRTYILLANPRVPVPTSHVFAALGPRRGIGTPSPPEGGFANVHALVGYLRDMLNDLELPARVLAPSIAELLQEMSSLPNILLARMSGSGASCFGLFADENALSFGAQSLRARYPRWWVVETTFSDGA